MMYALEIGSTGVPIIIFWNKLKWIFICSVPVVWAITILAYTGHEEWAKGRRLFLFFALPIVFVSLVFTNDFHHVMWGNIYVVRKGSFLLLRPGIPAPPG